ncbi:MAG TPA: hypothetical protein VFU14_09145, partial [Acidimicrobiales bacterium]|nr:hypothetical protein [Acidimicrobiales bacterium]
MSVTSDATHVGSDPGSPQVHGPGGGGLRGPLNWFGLAFGLVVLVGVALLFALTDGPGRATEDADAVDVATEPRATEERRAADEPAA